MGWGYGEVWRRGELIEVGYGVDAQCEHPDCSEEIDRGLGWLCGSMHGDPEDGCGGYFCGNHEINHDCPDNYGWDDDEEED